MDMDDLAQGFRLICARQQADTVVITSLMTAHPDARGVLDHLNRLADADSEHAEHGQPTDDEALHIYQDRLRQWIGLARHCSAAAGPSARPSG